MNRRHFFAISLPTLLGGTALSASAQNKPKPTARRIKIEVSRLKSALAVGDTHSQTIVVVAEENAAAYAAFIQRHTFDTNAAKQTANFQTFGPTLSVTPRISADGHITLVGKVQFEEALPSTTPNMPLAISTNSTSFSHTVESGHVMTLGGTIMGDEQQVITLTATLLDAASNIEPGLERPG